MRMRRSILAGTAVLFLAVAAAVFLQTAKKESESRQAIERLFATTLDDQRGQLQALAQWRGKVVVVNFWATWCPPCIEEMPSMRNLHGKLKDDPRFVMIAVSADDSWAPVKEFFQKEPPTFRVALDASGNLARQYGTEKFPETYVIVDGKIVGYIIGPRNRETWYAEAYLKALMEEGPLG